MAKPETVVLSVRVSPELLAQVDGAGARTEIVVAALHRYFDPRVLRQSTEKVATGVRHQSGPVLASAVPSAVTGNVEWSGLKGPKK